MEKDLKYAAIDTMSPEDINGLFEIIATKIFNKKPIDLKKEAFNLKGGPKELEKYQVTAHDMINLIVAYDIKFELKINWMEGEEKSSEIIPEKPAVTETANAMDNQKNEIKNPELKEAANASNSLNENNNNAQNKVGDLGKTPDPPNFLES